MVGGCYVELSKCWQAQLLCCHFMQYFISEVISAVYRLSLPLSTKNTKEPICVCVFEQSFNPWAISALNQGSLVIGAITFKYDPISLSLLICPCGLSTLPAALTPKLSSQVTQRSSLPSSYPRPPLALPLLSSGRYLNIDHTKTDTRLKRVFVFFNYLINRKCTFIY